MGLSPLPTAANQGLHGLYARPPVRFRLRRRPRLGSRRSIDGACAPREQVPVPQGRGRGLHGGHCRAPGEGRSRGGVLGDGPPGQHPHGTGRHVRVGGRLRVTAARRGRPGQGRRSHAVVDLGPCRHRARRRAVPARRRPPPQRVPPAVAVHPRSAGPPERSRGPDAARLQAGLPHLPLPRQGQGVRGVRRPQVLERPAAAVPRRLGPRQRDDGPGDLGPHPAALVPPRRRVHLPERVHGPQDG